MLSIQASVLCSVLGVGAGPQVSWVGMCLCLTRNASRSFPIYAKGCPAFACWLKIGRGAKGGVL
jgi:hypothetical protein